MYQRGNRKVNFVNIPFRTSDQNEHLFQMPLQDEIGSKPSHSVDKKYEETSLHS